MSLSYPNFQIILHKSDPRTVLIFNHSISTIWPHTVTLSKDRNCELVRYPHLGARSRHQEGSASDEEEDKPASPDSATTTRAHAAGGASNATRALRNNSTFSATSTSVVKQSADAAFQAVFDDCFDNGKWLFVENMSQVSHGAWRYVGQRLAGTVPAREFLMRKHFRLITFLSPGLEPHTLAPALLCQYAMVVDIGGEVHAKSDVGPLFESDANMSDISSALTSAKKALLETGVAIASTIAENASKNDETNRMQPYLTVLQSKRKLQMPNASFAESVVLNGSLHKSCGSVTESDDFGTQGSTGGPGGRGVIDLDDPERPGALDEQYIEELISCLKEDLLLVQAEMIESTNDSISNAIAEADAKSAHNMAGAHFGEDSSDEGSGSDDFGGGLGVSRQSGRDHKLRASERELEDRRKALFDGLTQQANDNYDWIYPEMAQWVLSQSPSVNFKIIPRIHDSQISKEGVIWQNYAQTCYNATWNGSEVMLHTPVPCYNTHASDILKKEMQKEASTHFNVRHPAILAFYGILAKDECSMVTEAGIGSLEQTFVRARHSFEHWSVRDYLLLAQQVLQGLTYLSTNLTHRDLACRSIIEVREKTLFKIGRFGLSQSIKGYSGDDNTKVAVRWAAPEALTGMFSPKSDMWSFGMLMWEALHYATSLPYASFKQAGDAILGGEIERCYTPAAAPLYNMLCLPCFEEEPEARPLAGTLLAAVEKAMLQWDAELLNTSIPFPNENNSAFR